MSRLVSTLDMSEGISGKFGCIEQASSNVNKNLLSLFIKLVRGIDCETLSLSVKKCATGEIDDLVNLMILWWETRSYRLIGKGERSIFYDMIPFLIEVVGIEAVVATISLIPKFGYYKDFCYILEKNFDERLNERIIDIFTKQLIDDYASFRENGKISMAAKYAPSEKTHFRKFARIFAERIYIDDKTCYKRYRKMKSELNAYLNLCDTKIFDESSVYPLPNITLKTCTKPGLEKDWNCLLNYIAGQIEDKNAFKHALALVDISDSMVGKRKNAGMCLGLIVSELSQTFHNRILTFGSEYNWINLSSLHSLPEKLDVISKSKNGGCADFCKAIESILSVAEDLKLSASELPKIIFVFSDMQAKKQEDVMSNYYEYLQLRFKETGERICGKAYNLPRIVFWNLNANIGDFQCISSDNVQYFSGFDASLLKYVSLTNNASKTLSNILADEKFLPIRQILSRLKEGIFKSYEYCCEKDGFVIVYDD
tara:strand:- start:402 stop:1850 length:1449 start_codon:yes stop_codon:yes gene_type:complete